MASASSCRAARTTSSTERLGRVDDFRAWPDQAAHDVDRRVVPSNRLAAVTKRNGVALTARGSWLAGVAMAHSGMISGVTNCSAGVSRLRAVSVCAGRATGSSVPCLCHAWRAAPADASVSSAGSGGHGVATPGRRPASAGRPRLPFPAGKDSVAQSHATPSTPPTGPPRHDAPAPRHPMKQRIKRIPPWACSRWPCWWAAACCGRPPDAAGHRLPASRCRCSRADRADRELEPLLAAPGQDRGDPAARRAGCVRRLALSARVTGRSLDPQYYIWHDDLTGHLLMHGMGRRPSAACACACSTTSTPRARTRRCWR